MTELLERAFAEAAKLPESEQESFARWMLDELASDERWQQRFRGTTDTLSRLAKEALQEYHAGQAHPLDPQDL